MKDTVELTKNTNQNGSSTPIILLRKKTLKVKTTSSKVTAARRRIGIRKRRG